MNRENRNYMAALRSKIPDGVRDKLELAFAKGFGAVFEYGDEILDKTYSREKENRRFIARDLGFVMDGDSASLRSFEKSGALSDSLNMLITTVEGVGLGALGIGMPDIVLFVAMLLRGVREAAAQYGRNADSDSEKFLALRMLETAMLSGEDWVESDNAVEQMLAFPESHIPTPEAFDAQLHCTASAFATDLLVLKFVQGLPIVGLVGGLSNPIYYRKVMNYVRLKYERAYISEAMGRDKTM